jgi:CRISPR-associated protein Cmr6
MAIQLMRSALRPLYRAAADAHPGLLIQRGYEVFDNESEEGKQRKAALIERVCGLPASPLYTRAFGRWSGFTRDPGRFKSLVLPLETRLFVGLTGGGALETGCAISHSYGMPYIPGSSVKGVVTASVRATPFADGHRDLCAALFGADPTEEEPQGLGGVIHFHDAWWVPGSAATPMIQEVVTTHHLGYYGSEGATPATDLDSPVPNAQIAVRGAFRFVLEGSTAWLPLAAEMLTAALTEVGIGAKTRAGYGLFRPPRPEEVPDPDQPPPVPVCPWVDETIAALMRQNRAKADDTLRGKGLAAAWQAIENADLKAQALADIQARWQAKGWWDDPPGGAARQAKATYTAT